MKRIIPFVAAVLVALSSQAQSVNVHMTDANNTVVKYNASQVDYIDFTKPIAASDGLEAVDLGLPSGTKWANMNVGATTKEDYGTYFAWGETQPKDSYGWDSYQWGSWLDALQKASITKYNNRLNPEDDAATMNWGGKWRMPTKEEFEELLANSTITFETKNDSVVFKVTSKKTGKSIYFPPAGRWNGVHVSGEREEGLYWTSTLSEVVVNKQHVNAYTALFVNWTEINPEVYGGLDETYRRPCGQPVRPVIAKSDVSAFSVAPAGVEAVDMGVSVLWANMNVGAKSEVEWGNYYAWGEHITKQQYGWYYEDVKGFDEDGRAIGERICPNYKHGAYDTGITGYTGLTVLESADDAATANWGDGWRMPTKEDFKELLENTTFTSGKENGVAYGKFTSKINGKSIYFPAGGYYDGKSNYWENSNGVYYSSTVNTDNFTKAFYMGFDKNGASIGSHGRTYGYNIRPVKK